MLLLLCFSERNFGEFSEDGFNVKLSRLKKSGCLFLVKTHYTIMKVYHFLLITRHIVLIQHPFVFLHQLLKLGIFSISDIWPDFLNKRLIFLEMPLQYFHVKVYHLMMNISQLTKAGV